MKFKDVAHLYIGCTCEVEAFGRTFVEHIQGIKYGRLLIGGKAIDLNSYDNYKPILRPITDMTEAEGEELLKVAQEGWDAIAKGEAIHLDLEVPHTRKRFAYLSQQFCEMTYMTSKGFDLFGLIESGEAIDATKLPF